MVFIDIKDFQSYADSPSFLPKEVYEIRNVMYTYIDNKEDIEKIKQGFEKDGLGCFIEDGVLYITGTDKKKQELLDKVKGETENLTKQLKDMLNFDDNSTDNPLKDDYEKDYIDRLAEKYRKEAEDKGKLN